MVRLGIGGTFCRRAQKSRRFLTMATSAFSWPPEKGAEPFPTP